MSRIASSPALPLISMSEKGLYCSAGDFYIDPRRAVETAVITHAHSDHARRGSSRYLCTSSSVGLLKNRLGNQIQVRGIPYRESFQLGSAQLSFHPAGHMLGSAQVRIQHGSDVWVVSGDYKRESDASCHPFETVACNTFITEATFGTPKHCWSKTHQHGRDIHEWWAKNSADGCNSLLFGYSMGKAQRILAELAPHAHRPILVHRAIAEASLCYHDEGRTLAQFLDMETIRRDILQGELILAPPSILETDWLKRLGRFRTAFASGWMLNSSLFYSKHYDHGFVMSDHADWNDINRTIDETGAQRIFVLHRNGVLIRHLRKRGFEAYPASALAPEQFSKLPRFSLSLFERRP